VFFKDSNWKGKSASLRQYV